MELCNCCPRRCGADRASSFGFCKESEEMRVAKVMLHHFEEPCISGGEGGAGSGAIFFSGCSLRCVFCQNKEISRGGVGEAYTARRLADEMLRLQEDGAYNINFVTPTHFTKQIIEAVGMVRGELSIPVVWNTSGYELPETVRALSETVDIFLTDFKYVSPEIAARYSSAPDYAIHAASSLREMVKITGGAEYRDGLMTRGTVVRHLVLPGAYRDSIEVLRTVDRAVGAKSVVLSLMAQYTPEFLDEGYPELSRRITTFEYNRVLDEAIALGYEGYMQSRSSASSRYTPDFGKDKR